MIDASHRSRPPRQSPPDPGSRPGPHEIKKHRFKAAIATAKRKLNREAAKSRPEPIVKPGPDPRTADVDYEREEIEFMLAMHEYQHATGHKFPTYTEILRVLKALGYERPGTDDGSGPGS